jgi:hypothetical protein
LTTLKKWLTDEANDPEIHEFDARFAAPAVEQMFGLNVTVHYIARVEERKHGKDVTRDPPDLIGRYSPDLYCPMEGAAEHFVDKAGVGRVSERPFEFDDRMASVFE